MDSKNIQDRFEQKNVIDYIDKNIINGQWITVSGSFSINDFKVSIWSGLVSKKYEGNLKRDYSWDVDMGGGYPSIVGFNDDYAYEKSTLDSGLEAFVFYREFYGVKEDYVELSQEFILYYNLYYDKKTNRLLYLRDNGDFEEVVVFKKKNQIKIRTNYLLNYLAVKKMKLVIYFDSRYIYKDNKSKVKLKTFKYDISDDHWYCFACGNADRLDQNKFYSRLLGKRIINFPNKGYEEILNFPELHKYVEFIVGKNSDGTDYYFSCDHNKLNNFFNSKPDSPQFLTPIYFRKQVLEKYYSNSELYTVGEASISCKGMWHLPIDNYADNVVSVYLGDLGQCLSYEEQQYWKSFNTSEIPSGDVTNSYIVELNNNHNFQANNVLGRVSVLRDNLCSWEAESNHYDHVFLSKINDINNYWNSKYGFKLFKPLRQDDNYILNQIRIPINGSQNEFDDLIGKLSKIVIDSINKKEITKFLSENSKKEIKGKGTIVSLYKFLEEQGYKNIKVNIEILHNIQELRSYGDAHRKNDDYKRIMIRQNIDKENLTEAYLEKLKDCVAFFDYLMTK